MNQAGLTETVKAAAARKRISCGRLLSIAQRRGASPALLGRICDREGIKITRCKLGCFA